MIPPISDCVLLAHSQSKKVYKIHNLSDEEATLVEPASCAIHGLDKLNPPVGVEALIFGAGPTGRDVSRKSVDNIDHHSQV